MSSTRAGAFVFAAALALFACGDDPSAPKISMLRIEPPEGVHPGETLTVSVDFTDADADVGGGTAELGLHRKEEPEGDLVKTPLAGGSSSQGSITLTVALPAGAIPGLYQLSVTVVDAAGRRSNPLTADFDVLR